jgi:hypothetical protein
MALNAVDIIMGQCGWRLELFNNVIYSLIHQILKYNDKIFRHFYDIKGRHSLTFDKFVQGT